MAKVLVIDDQAEVRTFVRRCAQLLGHTVREAVSGREGLDLLETEPPDLVITDIYMPDMDGMELCARLQQLPVKPRVIAMSGGGYRDATEVLELARRMGAVSTLAKPFTVSEVSAAMNVALAGWNGPSNPTSETAQERPGDPAG